MDDARWLREVDPRLEARGMIVGARAVPNQLPGMLEAARVMEALLKELDEFDAIIVSGVLESAVVALREFKAALRVIADNPCQVFPVPGPTRDADEKLVWPSNCVAQVRWPLCMSCRARVALAKAKQ